MKPWRVWGRPGVADWHHFDEKPDADPDPHSSKKSDPDQHERTKGDPDPHKMRCESATLLLSLALDSNLRKCPNRKNK